MTRGHRTHTTTTVTVYRVGPDVPTLVGAVIGALLFVVIFGFIIPASTTKPAPTPAPTMSEPSPVGEAGGASGPTVAPRVSIPLSARTSVRGWSTWYDAPSKQDAAAGPSLRRALGPGWRGTWVRVSHVGDGTVRSVTVRLTDFCACGSRNGKPTVLDLDDQAFADLASLGAGVISVRVEVIDGVPAAPTGPPTDVEP